MVCTFEFGVSLSVAFVDVFSMLCGRCVASCTADLEELTLEEDRIQNVGKSQSFLFITSSSRLLSRLSLQDAIILIPFRTSVETISV